MSRGSDEFVVMNITGRFRPPTRLEIPSHQAEMGGQYQFEWLRLRCKRYLKMCRFCDFRNRRPHHENVDACEEELPWTG